jgi:hypothetical protein
VDLSISVNSSHTLQRKERDGNMGMYAFHVSARTYAHFADLHMWSSSWVTCCWGSGQHCINIDLSIYQLCCFPSCGWIPDMWAIC